MFRWSPPTRKKSTPSLLVRPRRITLNLEALEARYCPSTLPVLPPVEPPDFGPSDTALILVTDSGLSLRLSAVPGPRGTATVSGQVSGALPKGGLTVTLSGVVSGLVATNPDGTFAFTGPSRGPGQIQAAVNDAAGNVVTSSANLVASPPSIVNFQANYNGNNNWTFTGQVQDPNAVGLVVTIAGIPSLTSNNASATVQANGSFSYTVTLQPGEGGGVTAQCIDWWGQTSNEAAAYVVG
jgi:hypothetical protein